MKRVTLLNKRKNTLRSFVKIIMLVTISFLTISCAATTPLTQSELERVKTVAILADLPEYPSYNIHGFSTLASRFGKIPDKSFRERVIATVSNYLRSKGYKVIVVSNKNSAAGEEVDLLLDVTGSTLGDSTYEYGYGVSQVYLYESDTALYTYASLAVFPSLGREASRAGSRAEKSTYLAKKELTANWESLPQDGKEEISKSLNSDIEAVTTELMKNLGI